MKLLYLLFSNNFSDISNNKCKIKKRKKKKKISLMHFVILVITKCIRDILKIITDDLDLLNENDVLYISYTRKRNVR